MSISRRRAGLAALTVGTAAVTLAGCGSSSGPKAPTAAQDAAHYDSLASALNAVGTRRDTTRAQTVEILNGVIANGQKPGSVTVTLNGSTTTWLGNFANLVDSAGTDSLQVISLWSDTHVDDYVFVAFINGQPDLVEDIVMTGDLNSDSVGTLSGAFATASGTCSLTTITNVYPTVNTYGKGQSTCERESATGTASITFHSDTTATGGIQTLAFTSQTVPGVRLKFTGSAGFPSHVAPPLSAAGARRLLGVR
jgi:hypothetical protein